MSKIIGMEFQNEISKSELRVQRLIYEVGELFPRRVISVDLGASISGIRVFSYGAGFSFRLWIIEQIVKGIDIQKIQILVMQ